MDEMLMFLQFIAESEGWPLSKKCIKYLKRVVKTTRLGAEDYLLEPGNVCKNLYFIHAGLLKCYYIVHDRAVCEWFFGEWETVVSIDSFYDQVPSQDFIQAIEDCVLYYITFDQLNYLYRTFVEFNVVGRVLTNKYLRIWHRQAKNIRMLTAEERYIFLLENQPGLIQRVTVKDLSSYLDMSSETLSRVRGRYY